jgi:L-aspartate oxidase
LPGVPPFLISEAVRGEGGVLRDVKGSRFMPDYAAESDLAPRDVVARGILHQMIKTGSDRVFLDVTHIPPRQVTTRFPHIYRFCLEHGLDITKDPIPVAPAAHYFMGGVKVNVWGETNIKGLFAAGENACTGVHGANRLASNSLLEVIVFSKRIVDRTKQTRKNASLLKSKAGCHSLGQRSSFKNLPRLNLSNLQSLMWDKVGIIRNGKDLAKAADILYDWQISLSKPTDRPSYELNNMILNARLITESALLREESRGAHFRTDFPKLSPDWQKHTIFKKTNIS